MDPIGMAQTIYGLGKQIYAQVEQAKANKSQCQRLAERVGIVERSIRGLDLKKGNHSAGLQDLIKILEGCLELVHKFSNKKNWFREILQAGSNDASFKELAEELQRSLQVLNVGLAAQ